TTRYDGDGLVVETTGPGAARFCVDRGPFQIVHHDLAPDGPVVRTESFDAHGRLVALEDVVDTGHTIVTNYDLELDGRVAALRDGSGSARATWIHAGPGEPVRITEADAGTRTYYRDAAGRLVERVDADGTSVLFSFDAIGRVVAIDPRGPSGTTRLRTVVYDADPDPAHPSAGRFLDGRVAVADEGDHRCRYSYDHAGRPVREEFGSGGDTLAIVRSHDLQGNLRTVSYPDGSVVTYDRHASGAVVGVVGVADTFEHDADGAVLGWRFANGTRVELERDADTRRTTAQRAVAAGGAALRSFEYGYDAIGTLTTVLDAGAFGSEHHTYAYDGLH